jgi:hypothetical protein
MVRTHFDTASFEIKTQVSVFILFEDVSRSILDTDIFVKLQLGCHPVAVVQCTFAHKQYIEQRN